MIQSGVFNYVNVLNKAADGSWLRNEAIANNIANADTPHYKRHDVSFEAELQHALTATGGEMLDQKVKKLNQNGNLMTIQPRTYIDSPGYSYRLDKNNVDIDNENVELASNQIKYNGLIQSVNDEFSNLKTVIK